MDNKYKKLVNNTKIFAVGNIITKLSQYIIIALCTHRLTTAEFGISDTIIHTVAMLVPIFSADIAEGLFRFSMDPDYSKKEIISNSALVNIIGGIIAILAFPIEYLLLKNINTALLVTILTIFEMAQASVKEFVRGLGLTKNYMISGLLNALTQILGCLVFIYLFNLGITGYILTLATAYLAEILYCAFIVEIKQYISPNALSKRAIKDLLKYSLPLAPNKIMWWIISASDRYFILWIIGASATGLYSVAARFPALITIVVGFFFQAWQISALETKESRERDKFYSSIFNMLWVSICILSAAMLCLIKFAVRILVSETFFDSWKYAPFLLSAAAFSALQSFLGVNYTIKKDSVGALKSTSVAAVSNLVLNYFLISKMGIQGATIATLVSYIIVLVYRYYDTKKYVNITIENKSTFLSTICILVIEPIIISINPEFHPITILGLIVVVFLNRQMLIKVFNYGKNILQKRRVIK